MFGGRQTVAVWGCFAFGALLVVLTQRPQRTKERAPAWVENTPGGSVPLESDPFAGPTAFEQRVIATATRLGIDPAKSKCTQIDLIDKDINDPNRIVAVDIIVHRLRQQQKLVALESGNVSHARF